MKIPLKVLIVASHRTGSSLLGDILSYSRQGYINRYKIIDSVHKNSLLCLKNSNYRSAAPGSRSNS